MKLKTHVLENSFEVNFVTPEINPRIVIIQGLMMVQGRLNLILMEYQ